MRLQSLAVVLGWLDPDDETRRPWLRRLLARLEATAKPVRDKRSRLRGADELLALGQRLMEGAEAGDGDLRQRAQRYRDGLMIATLACRPLRLKSLVGLDIGRQLQRREDGWWIEIAAAETKTGEPISVPFPENLVPALEAYLQCWRPRLASPGRVAASMALWLTEQGRGKLVDPPKARTAALGDVWNWLVSLFGGTSKTVNKEAASQGNVRAKLALDVFVGAIRQYLGAYLVELGGADVIVFTGGIGENDAGIRSAVCENLAELGIAIDPAANAQARGEAPIHAAGSVVQVWIVPTNEEIIVARQARELLEGRS